MARSLEETIRELIIEELDRTREESDLAQSIRELTNEIGRLTSGIAAILDQQAGTAPPKAAARIDAARLEASYRPDDVRVLFVASHTSIASPEHTFYFANSH